MQSRNLRTQPIEKLKHCESKLKQRSSFSNTKKNAFKKSKRKLKRNKKITISRASRGRLHHLLKILSRMKIQSRFLVKLKSSLNPKLDARKALNLKLSVKKAPNPQ